MASNKARIVITVNVKKHADLLRWVAALPENCKSEILRAAIYEFMQRHPEPLEEEWSSRSNPAPAGQVELDWEVLGKVVRNVVKTELANVQIVAPPNKADDLQDRETDEVKTHIDDMLESWGGFDDDDE